MLTDSQFKVTRILYIIIGLVLLSTGIFLYMSDIVRAQASGVLMIVLGCILFHDVRIARIERKLRVAESEKKQTNG